MTQFLQSLKWENENLLILDQTMLPHKIVYRKYFHYKQVVMAIQKLIVRGAPAIGVAASYGMVLAVKSFLKEGFSGEVLKKALKEAAACFINARPTAVNLSWSVNQMLELCLVIPEKQMYRKTLEYAVHMQQQDQSICKKIAMHGAGLFVNKKNLHILTHCNTGALATSGVGTALGIITELFNRDQLNCVYIDETRPILQGSRLTASELIAANIPCKLICDNMAALVMKSKEIDAIIVGADRIAKNGDPANKIGTYALAIAASYHRIPFYVAAPFSTFDFNISSGDYIIIEERSDDEIKKIGTEWIAPAEISTFNPAFDITPHHLITAIITESGVIYHPNIETVTTYENALIKK